jgi:hypothetical protein
MAGRARAARPFAVLALALGGTGCVVTATPEPVPAVLEPPEIEFAGLVTDVRIYADHVEFTDGAGEVHAVDLDAYRDVTGHDWSGPLLVLGSDASGGFVASFPTQDGLPPDCYRETVMGRDRGAHIEINGVLWRKSPAFVGTIPYGATYPPGTRFCFDEEGRVASLIER